MSATELDERPRPGTHRGAAESGTRGHTGDELPMAPAGPSPVYALLRWTIPVHALLPLAIAALVASGGPGIEGLLTWSWVIVHVAFPVLLVASYPWWRGRGDEVALVVVLNHAVTFAVGIAVLAYW